jgi:hypothetical protein
MYRNGTWSVSKNSGATVLASGNWVTPTSDTIGASYWMRFSVVGTPYLTGSGALSGDSLGTWLEVGSSGLPLSYVTRLTSVSTLTGEANAVYRVEISTTNNGSNIVSDSTLTLVSTSSA